MVSKVPPQPLGILGGPPGALILPIVPGHEGTLYKLIRGNFENIPPSWEFFRLTAENQEDAAIEFLQRKVQETSEWLWRYNHFVFTGDRATYNSLAESAPNQIYRTVLGCVAFLHGLKDDVPDASSNLPFEVQAFSK